MTNIPFTPDRWSKDFKESFSGGNLTLDYFNIESTLFRIGIEISKTLGDKTYAYICSMDNEDQAKVMLKRAMINFSMYHHLIYFIAKIGNDGITVKKTDGETTIFKYQQIELENKIISDALFWMDNLLVCLNDRTDEFTDWHNSPEQSEYRSAPISVDDFNRFVGIRNEYFVMRSRWIIRSVWEENVLSRMQNPVRTNNLLRAVCYQVMAIACISMDYYMLPEPIRKDINSEVGKDIASQSGSYTRESLSAFYKSKAESYWRIVDNDITTSEKDESNEMISPHSYQSASLNKNEKYCLS